jgi:serine phosphatase RsbU (regulator of sigma subunit)
LIGDYNNEVIFSLSDKIKNLLNPCQIVVVQNIKDIIHQVLQWFPNLVILEVGINSQEVIPTIRILKRLRETKNIPVILTSYESTLLDDFFSAGADDFIFPPFSLQNLYYRLKVDLQLGETLNTIKKQNELLTHQSEELKKQYNLVDVQRKDMIADITYSRRIQNAIIPSRETLAEYFTEYFLFFRPKRIVSGDFYWVATRDNKTIVAVADCTGHGISGAFLTVAGIAFLNEIINYTPLNAAEFLNQLRYRIMRLLHQRGVEGETTDGMDISLAIIDFENLELQFAGANTPAYLINNNNLTILPPDKMPIGIHELSNKPFKNQNLSLSKGNMLYLFSDGYIDQFGGPNDQKFRSKNFQELCLSASNLKASEQYKIFENTIDEWMGFRDQIDDITVIGIRI